MATQEKYLKPDSKGRIQLGRLAKDIVRYKVIQENDGKIILLPEVALPASEVWLYKNKEALAAVREGFEQSMSGKIKKRGSFAKYVESEG
jgi:hypothetical protein